MNTKKNERFAETDRRIREAAEALLMKSRGGKISVREICESTGLNRSSFYLHYTDIPALLEAVIQEKWRGSMERIQKEMQGNPNILSKDYVVVTLREVEREAAFYGAYLQNFGTAEIEKGYQMLFESLFKPFFRKLGITDEHRMEYHFEFTKAGFFAVVRKWLSYGCAESPEALAEILMSSMAPLPEDLAPVFS